MRHANRESTNDQTRLPECFAGEVVKVLLAEVPSARRLPLHVEGVPGLGPCDLVGDDEGGASPLSKSIVPGDGGEGCRLLVSVHNHDHGEGERPNLFEEGHMG